MSVKKFIVTGAMIIVMFQGFLFSQTVLKLPELLTRAEKRISINCLLGKSGNQLLQPWVVFSDRDKGYDHFGDKYYVVEERETELHVYKASGCRERKLISAEDRGWKRKSDLLVSFGADFTENSLIHKKCAILNHHNTIERIKRGEISESEIPLYNSSTDLNSVNNVPLYLIYFVYKIENNRYLLGKDYKFDPDQPFSEQIIGWVDRERVFDYNNRICFEPACDELAVSQRRCRPEYAAKVFEFQSDLKHFLQGDTTQKPIWVEPEYYFFRNPKFNTGNPGMKEPYDINERNYTNTLLEKLCEFNGDITGIRQSQLLTGRSLPGNKFRFPLIRKEKLPENIFMTGVTGRFVNDVKSRTLLCDALRTNKSRIDVCFILDNSIDRNRLTYVIGQIQQGFTEFQKKFGVCFFPRQQIGQYKISIGDHGNQENQDNYRYVRDFIQGYQPGKGFEIKNDNVLGTLKYVLDNESFDSKHINIVVMVNNHAISVPDTGLAMLRRDIQNRMVEKNCYLLAFDYKGDNNLVQQLQEISVAAGRQYAGRLNISSQEIAFRKTEIGYEMVNATLLSIIEQTDSTQLAAVQMEAFLQTGYSRIVNTIDNAIQQICRNDNQQKNAVNHHEDPFQRALRDVPGLEGKVQYIRALEEGYSAIRYDLPGQDYTEDIWKANVLMTKPELEALGSLLDKMLVQANNSNFSKSIYDLWTALFNRFVGDNLTPDELLPMTPQMIMGKILGETYGYIVTDPVKRYPLERILANDQGVQKYFDEYKMKLTTCNANIKEILTTGRLRFSLAEDANSANQPSIKKGIYYYWVPMDILP